ncbi:M42 family metallopeptidase [Shouchella sp. JSM 1781072]|uniref:M42 family metallopeptidase n=1 Tax=Bacillaceae TaxID=186817 RepID=UPI000C08C681|nr:MULTISPECIES: M42 family metallopeptidase [Bacillaceae]UTR07756.1 M42 family metallopeptidase [Alkalihalobacillus sp. LMS6]
MKFKKAETIKLLEELVHIPSPSGYTEDAIAFVEAFLKTHEISYRKSNKGALIATIEGEDTTSHRMLTAHVDTLGAIVKELKPNGRLRLDLVGGFAYQSIEGEYVTIHKSDGTTVSGTVVVHQSSVHVYKDARTIERTQKNMEIRVDAKVEDIEGLRQLGVDVGDFVSFAPRFEQTETGFIKSRHLDDKASVSLVLMLMKELKASQMKLPYTTHVLISNNEEIGYGGNASIPPEVVEYVAVDMGAIGDGQQSDEYTVSICVKDSSGPYHYGLRNHFVQLCKDNEIPYKLDIYPYYGSDASAAIRSGHDIVHGLIGPGIEGSHSMERTHEQSLEATFNLLYAYMTTSMNH